MNKDCEVHMNVLGEREQSPAGFIGNEKNGSIVTYQPFNQTIYQTL